MWSWWWWWWVVGSWWLVAGGWWLVGGGCWVVVGGLWLVVVVVAALCVSPKNISLVFTKDLKHLSKLVGFVQ